VTVADRTACTPHLRQDEYRLADTVAVPAKRGDIVCFNINTVHGSYLNSTRSPRRLVRMGYRHAGNAQLSGQAFGRPGIMVAGSRPRGADQRPFSENT
jgi:ectoine hydroxylase-related dioxygenase (phytanoyl-CoA dioxygenase family)